ncbi:MAG: DUF2127 domain-containing protein [Candidatus Kapabacteria bacterium]|nr:DUF2127 domain-containing protein [Candidatus Kapabacteria bacterium]
MKKFTERQYLHFIALTKVAKGTLLLFIGISLLFLDWREEVLNAIITWTDEEVMLVHSKIVLWLLAKLQVMLEETHFRTTGYAALAYSVLLFTEGIGVWKQQRWAEWLMVIGTGSLIPFELYHFSHKPSIFKVCIIVLNSFIVWYLIQTLRRKHNNAEEHN